MGSRAKSTTNTNNNNTNNSFPSKEDGSGAVYNPTSASSYPGQQPMYGGSTDCGSTTAAGYGAAGYNGYASSGYYGSYAPSTGGHYHYHQPSPHYYHHGAGDSSYFQQGYNGGYAGTPQQQRRGSHDPYSTAVTPQQTHTTGGKGQFMSHMSPSGQNGSFYSHYASSAEHGAAWHYDGNSVLPTPEGENYQQQYAPSAQSSTSSPALTAGSATPPPPADFRQTTPLPHFAPEELHPSTQEEADHAQGGITPDELTSELLDRQHHSKTLRGNVYFLRFPSAEEGGFDAYLPENADTIEKTDLVRMFLGQLPYRISPAQANWLCRVVCSGSMLFHVETILKKTGTKQKRLPTGCLHAFAYPEQVEPLIDTLSNGRVLFDSDGIWWAQNDTEFKHLNDYCAAMKADETLRVRENPYQPVVVQRATSNFSSLDRLLAWQQRQREAEDKKEASTTSSTSGGSRPQSQVASPQPQSSEEKKSPSAPTSTESGFVAPPSSPQTKGLQQQEEHKEHTSMFPPGVVAETPAPAYVNPRTGVHHYHQRHQPATSSSADAAPAKTMKKSASFPPPPSFATTMNHIHPAPRNMAPVAPRQGYGPAPAFFDEESDL